MASSETTRGEGASGPLKGGRPSRRGLTVEFKQQSPEEFVVEEIAEDGTIFEVGKTYALGKPEDQTLERDYFTHFVLEKREWNTLQALGALAARLHVKPSRFDHAGTKDRNAITTQLCSAFAVAPERILPANIKDVKINGAWKARKKVRLGDLAGNRFTITLTERNCGAKISGEQIVERARQLNYTIPNLFGSQRFGSQRNNTDLVGLAMLKGDFEAAVREYLHGSAAEESDSVREARLRLQKEGDFLKALEYFPEHLRYERTLLRYLAEKPTDFAGALRLLPRTLQLMFVHAFQSRLFNEIVGEKAEWYCLADDAGFPDVETVRKIDGEGEKLIEKSKAFPVGRIIGYEGELSEAEKQKLEEKGLSQESFRMKSMPELSSKGTFRALRVPLKDLEVLEENPLVVRFCLPSGSYATVAIAALIS